MEEKGRQRSIKKEKKGREEKRRDGWKREKKV